MLTSLPVIRTGYFRRTLLLLVTVYNVCVSWSNKVPQWWRYSQTAKHHSTLYVYPPLTISYLYPVSSLSFLQSAFCPNSVLQFVLSPVCPVSNVPASTLPPFLPPFYLVLSCFFSILTLLFYVSIITCLYSSLSVFHSLSLFCLCLHSLLVCILSCPDLIPFPSIHSKIVRVTQR